jgi:uncharacterized protein (TIGR02246 family)
MPAQDPEQLDELFEKALNSGDLDALVNLYEHDASLSPQAGQVVTGAKAIREALSAFVGMKPTITLRVKTVARTGDIALTSARWELTGTGPDGNSITTSGQSAEVSRRQPDGTWLFVIDSPYGLE